MEKEHITLLDAKTPKKSTWHQSANSLFNFMKKTDFLKIALTNMAIIPRYVEEYIDYLKINELEKIAYPMTCFCDIPFTKLEEHMRVYGSYGIAFDKETWGLQNGLQPIKYINIKSPLSSDFVNVFKKAYFQEIDIPAEYNFLIDYLISDLVYTKPIKGYMDINNEKTFKLFQDECEWRYVPQLPESLDIKFILLQRTGQEYEIKTYTSVLEAYEECWLKFNVENIKYIVVPDFIAQKEIISFIRKDMHNISDDEKDILISNIHVMKKLQGDMM